MAVIMNKGSDSVSNSPSVFRQFKINHNYSPVY
jgi:hypothetical protein